MTKAVFQGLEGSYGEEAAIAYFGGNAAIAAEPRFEDVALAIIENNAEFGVLPLENTTTGAVYQVYDLLGKYGCHIVGEVCLDICHCLLGVKGASIEEVTTVFSHEQGFWQCGNFLSAHRAWDLVPYHNTAISAKHVKDLSDKRNSAIASRRAMEVYGLDCLADNIQDQRVNMTRFIIASKEMASASAESNKISITFTLSHKSGTLFRILEIFDKAKLNLSKIESRPIIGSPWEYRFYLDFEGNPQHDNVMYALKECEKSCASYRMLGHYKTAISTGSN